MRGSRTRNVARCRGVFNPSTCEESSHMARQFREFLSVVCAAHCPHEPLYFKECRRQARFVVGRPMVSCAAGRDGRRWFPQYNSRRSREGSGFPDSGEVLQGRGGGSPTMTNAKGEAIETSCEGLACPTEPYKLARGLFLDPLH